MKGNDAKRKILEVPSEDTAVEDMIAQGVTAQEDITVESRSTLAEKLDKVRRATINAAESREHLPQPLFWSLFHNELREIKQAKSAKRLLESILSSK